MGGKALAGPVARLALRVEGWLRPRTAVVGEPRAESILILEYMLPLGACVHMTPVFEALKRRLGTTVIVATRGLALGLLRHSPFIDHLIATPDPLHDLRGAARTLRGQLAQRHLRPHCCLTGASDPRTRIALLGAIATGGWRGGFTVIDDLYQRPLIYDRQQSLIGNNLRLAGLVGAPAAMAEPKIFFSAADAAKARELLAPIHAESKPVLVAVTQNSGGQRTGWHERRWIETLRHAQAELGYGIVYAGTTANAEPIEALRCQAGGVSLAGATSVAELAALLALSDLVLSLDTGTMHVGRAAGVPMVVLGPSWQKPLEWLPLGKPHVRILRGEDRADVPEGYRLDEISAAAAIEALNELTALYPPDEAARETRLRAGLSAVDLLAG